MDDRYTRRFVEMANIPIKRTGLKKGYIQIRSEKAHAKFPHIHFVYDLKNSKNEFIKFTINKEIDKIEIVQNKLNVSTKEIEDIKKFISKNEENLINYYLQGEFIDTDTFLDSLKKI
jgi:hypothetical protein